MVADRWDWESQHLLHRRAGERNSVNLTGCDHALPEVFGWLSDGPCIGETQAKRDSSGTDVGIGDGNVDLATTCQVDRWAEVLVRFHQQRRGIG